MAARPEDILGDYLAALFTPEEKNCAAAETSVNCAPSDQSANQTLPSNIQKPNIQTPSNTQKSPVGTDAVPKPAGVTVPLPAPAENQLLANLPVVSAIAPVATLAEPARQQLQQLLNSAWQTKPVAAPAQPLKVDPDPIPTAAPVAEQFQTPEPPPVTPALPAPASIRSGRPAWAGKTFDSLIVEVAGLKLAIPLIVLGQIVRVTEGFAHLPGQGALFLGTLHTPRGTLRVINTALLVMPERYEASFIENVGFAVSIAQDMGAQNLPAAQSWQLALGVTKVAQPVNITSDDVVWRGERSKRPWLLGTVKTHMCALLDLSVIENLVAP